jgi:hypothetical protein
MHAWASPDRSLRLVERKAAPGDEDPKALACYGAYLPRSKPTESDMLLRFVEGRPVSGVTTVFLEWVCRRLAERSVRVWVLIWDRASWHLSHKVRDWIARHNRKVKREGGVRILACALPSKSPWLNPIEPKWLHGKRAVCEPDGDLSPEVLIERVHTYYGSEQVAPIEQETA